MKASRYGRIASTPWSLKQSLLLRPLEHAARAEPHILAGWLSVNRDCYNHDRRGKLSWNENPLELLARHLSFHEHGLCTRAIPASTSMIWDHDNEILQQRAGLLQ